MDKSPKNEQKEQFVSPYLKVTPRSLEEVMRARDPAMGEARTPEPKTGAASDVHGA